jgi:hypothetical protein
MGSSLVLHIISTFNCTPFAARLQPALADAAKADAVQITPPSQFSNYMLDPSEDAKDLLGTLVAVRVEDWLRGHSEAFAGKSPDVVARQLLRQHFDEFFTQVSMLALRGRPVWLLICPTTGWIAEQFKLATLCRTMTNLFSARARNLSLISVLTWPSSLTIEDGNHLDADRNRHIPFTQRAFEELAESVAAQLVHILDKGEPNAASAAATRSPELAAFLAGLKIQVEVALACRGDRTDVDRILRTAATFSLAGERPTISDVEVEAILESGHCYLVTVIDRLSEHGASGLIVACPTDGALLVTAMSLSCPVLGKQVEFALLSGLAQLATAQNLSTVDFEFRASGRNQSTLEFLKSIAKAGPGTRYTIAVSEVETHIQTAAVAPSAWSLNVVAAKAEG